MAPLEVPEGSGELCPGPRAPAGSSGQVGDVGGSVLGPRDTSTGLAVKDSDRDLGSMSVWLTQLFLVNVDGHWMCLGRRNTSLFIIRVVLLCGYESPQTSPYRRRIAGTEQQEFFSELCSEQAGSV